MARGLSDSLSPARARPNVPAIATLNNSSQSLKCSPRPSQIPESSRFRADLYNSVSWQNGANNSVTIGTQTDYRDSECQTDPYTPDYRVIPDANGNMDAALLHLKHLTFANGELPVGLEQVEAIERDLVKREIIKALPQSGDKRSIEIRRMALSEIEKQDWYYKEHIAKQKQQAKFERVMEQMKARDEAIEKSEERRLEQYRMKLQKVLNKHKLKIEEKMAKAQRQLSAKHKMAQSKVEKRTNSSALLSSRSQIELLSADMHRFSNDPIAADVTVDNLLRKTEFQLNLLK